MTTLLDTNILVRHFTGDSPDLSLRATAYLASAPPGRLLLLDIVVAEMVYVLQSVYRSPRSEIVRVLRSTLTLPAIRCDNRVVLHRATELYEAGSGWADSCLIATAEQLGVSEVLSFDRGLPRVTGITRIEPPELDPDASGTNDRA